MKIKKAEKLICPFIQAVDKGGWSRGNGKPANINCITCECMSWKFNYDTIKTPIEGMEMFNGQNITREYSKDDGYCKRLKT